MYKRVTILDVKDTDKQPKMARRHLTITEANLAIKRNKDVEIFIDGFVFKTKKCIRWASFRMEENYVVGNIWESFDDGSEDFLDIYSFSPLTEEWEPVQTVKGTTLIEVVIKMELPKDKFVNAGVVQDEYADYLAKNT